MRARRGALAQHTKYQIFGIAFIIVIALLLALTVAIYNKAFTPVAHVTLKTNRTGNQLAPPADVKLRGLIVGEVREIRSSGDQAELDLALNPDMIPAIPANVRARLLPKTLFGEKFVDLVVPEQPATTALRDGDVIAQDRSETAIETERVLDDLFPLLRAVKPAELSMTLNALSTALEGRGERLGENIEMAEAYFSKLNPHLPQLKEDFALLARFAETYADAAPDLLRILRNSTAISNTVVDRRAQLEAFFHDTTGTANKLRSFVNTNDERIISLARVSRPTLDVLATYSPEYPCFLRSMVEQIQTTDETLRKSRLHLTIEITRQRKAYQVGADRPRFGALPGPNCRGLPDPPVPFPDQEINDGVTSDPYYPTPLGRALSAALVDPTSGYAGTEAEQQIVGALLAPSMSVSADQVPDIATLLFGPMVRGTEVSTR